MIDKFSCTHHPFLSMMPLFYHISVDRRRFFQQFIARTHLVECPGTPP